MRKSIPLAILEIVLGALFIVMAFVTFANPGTALEAFVVAYGLVAIISGVAYIVFFIRMARHTGFRPVTTLIGGIANIILGILLLTNVVAGAVALTLIFPIWFIISCIVHLVNLGGIRFINRGYYWFSLVANILGILIGLFLMLNPAAAAATMVYMIAFYFLIVGSYSIVAAIMRLMDKG